LRHCKSPKAPYIEQMKFAPLTHRTLLVVSGEDTLPFLQGLISNDTRKLEQGEAIYAALLTPQGKFLHDLFLVSWNGKIWIDCERARAEDLRKRLTLYKLRSKVTVEMAPETMGVVAVWDGAWTEKSEQYIAFADPRLPELGMRIMGDVKVIEAALSAQAKPGNYDAMRLALGVPDGSRDLIVEKSLLLDWGFDQLHGVDFSKGCYVGQEVTARMRYRGQTKKSMYLVKSTTPLPLAGTKIYCGEIEAGELRSSLDGIGLAVLRMEEVEKSKQSEMPLRAADSILEASFPAWLEKT
jgi:folate-binding protein YgfZ